MLVSRRKSLAISHPEQAGWFFILSKQKKRI